MGRKQSSDCNNLINFVVVLIIYRQHLPKYDCIKCRQEDWLGNFIRNKILGRFIFYKFGIVLREYYLSCHNMNPLLHYKVSNLTSSIIHQISNQLIFRKLIEIAAKIDQPISGRTNIIAIVFFERKKILSKLFIHECHSKAKFLIEIKLSLHGSMLAIFIQYIMIRFLIASKLRLLFFIS